MMTSRTEKTIWIDLDNSPHVPLFKPIIERLGEHGYCTFITARECFQTCSMADEYGYDYTKVGRHYGKNKLAKMYGLSFRALQLIPEAVRHRPVLALSHGSRSQTMAAALLRIPSVVMLDYEYARFLPIFRPDWVITPAIIPGESVQIDGERIYTYDGIKEDIYVKDFAPDPSLLDELGLNDENVLITIRPPANEAHYHNPESEVLFQAAVEMLGEEDPVRMVILPRNGKQEAQIRSMWPRLIESGKIVIPDKVVDGLNLLWHSDLAISGGGTMNREAAALGVPVYSIFRGETGAVDKYLSGRGSLFLLTSVDDVRTIIQPVKRDRSRAGVASGVDVVGQVVDCVQRIIG